MAAGYREEFMAVGGFTVDCQATDATRDLLADADGDPRDLYALIYGPDDVLLAPPFVLTRVSPSEEALEIGGPGILWDMGAGDAGPRIVDREYVSGQNKLDNGDFGEADLYWRRPAEGSLWLPVVGGATNAGGLRTDDALEFDRWFPTRPGQSHILRCTDVTGTGRWRQRIVYKGKFNPPNLLVGADFEDGGANGYWGTSIFNGVTSDGPRSGTYAMRFSPITKPELIPLGTFDLLTGWTGGTVIGMVNDPGNARSGSGVLRCVPNPQPQLISDPDNLTGWTDVSEFLTDMDIVSDPGNAYSGSQVIRCGPVTQKQLLLNWNFENGLANWTQASNSDPDEPGLYYHDPGGGVDGSAAATTAGDVALRAIKYLRADSSDGTFGTQAYAVVAGETWEAEAFLRCAPSTDGFAYLSLVFPHPTLEPAHPRWNQSQHMEGERNSTDVFNRLTVSDTVPTGRTKVNVLLEVHNHLTGYYAWDNVTLTRTRGNRAMIRYNTQIPVEANTEYELSAMVRAAGDMQVGNVRIGAVLRGPGLPDEVVDVDKGSTDFVWSRVPLRFKPADGYTSAQPFIAAVDIAGAPIYVDMVQLKKVENNSDQVDGEVADVITDQRYLLSASVRSFGATRGTVRVGVVLKGDGVPDLDVGVTQGLTKGGAWAGIKQEVRPPEGYTTAHPYVRSTDIEGGIFYVDDVSMLKMDNNVVETFGPGMTLIPERTYRYSMAVRTGPNLQRGTLKLVAICQNPATAEYQRFESSNLSPTGGAWTTLTWSFTPPSGFDVVYPTMIATDVEGDYIWADEGEVRDQSTDTVAIDYRGDPGEEVDLVAEAPEGATDVRCMVVVERGSSNWSLGSVSLARYGETPITGNDVVADMVTDPETGLPLSIALGSVTCPEVIPYDWVVQNLTNRDAFSHYCKVVSSPPREFRINATLPATVDVGTSEDVFPDHAPDSEDPIIYLATDVNVEKLPAVEVDLEDRATSVQVAGSEPQTVSGTLRLITATAPVPDVVRRDWNGNPRNRGRIVSDATVDHFRYAKALAEDLALAEAQPPVSFTLTLTGTDRPPLGDWIYVYHPKGGLEDPANPVEVDGRTVFPRRVRIFSRSISLGSGGNRIVMRRPDGSTFELPGVNWSDQDSCVLVVGDARPAWQRDNQGTTASKDYLRDRVARPRG